MVLAALGLLALASLLGGGLRGPLAVGSRVKLAKLGAELPVEELLVEAPAAALAEAPAKAPTVALAEARVEAPVEAPAAALAEAPAEAPAEALAAAPPSPSRQPAQRESDPESRSPDPLAPLLERELQQIAFEQEWPTPAGQQDRFLTGMACGIVLGVAITFLVHCFTRHSDKPGTDNGAGAQPIAERMRTTLLSSFAYKDAFTMTRSEITHTFRPQDSMETADFSSPTSASPAAS